MDTTPRIVQLEPSQLHSHKANIRNSLGDLTDLAASIRQKGVYQPLVVRPHPTLEGDYEVIMGHRRLAAAEKAGLAHLPCLIREDITSEAEAIQAMLIENVQRQDISKSEEGEAYQQLLDLGMSVSRIAKEVGRGHETVASRLAVAKLSDNAKKAVDTEGNLAGLERAVRVAEFEDYPDLKADLEEQIASAAFEAIYFQAAREREWRDWAEPAAARLDELGIRQVPAMTAAVGSWRPTKHLGLPIEPREVAHLGEDDLPGFITENIDDWGFTVRNTVRRIVWLQRETTSASAPESDDTTNADTVDAENSAEGATRTALRVSRARFVKHMKGLLGEESDVEIPVRPLLVHVMATEIGINRVYANILGVEIPEELSSSKIPAFLEEKFRRFTTNQLILAMFLEHLGINNDPPMVKVFALDSFSPEDISYSARERSREIAREYLGWGDSEGERLAKEYWEPKLPSIDDEVNF